jgi:hypothetical protein
MNRLRMPERALLCFVIGFFTNGPASAQPRLLAELHTFGSCFECSPPEMMYSIGFSIIQPSPQLSAGWGLNAGINDIGHEFSVPSELVPAFHGVLTYNGFVTGNMQCCNDVSAI